MRAIISILLFAGLTACKQHPTQATASEQVPVPFTTQTVVTVNGSGYHPAAISAAANSDISLTFLRTTDECCGQQLKIPSDGRTIDLPLNQRVIVNLHTPASGRLAFTCGMDMYRGAIVVR